MFVQRLHEDSDFFLFWLEFGFFKDLTHGQTQTLPFLGTSGTERELY